MSKPTLNIKTRILVAIIVFEVVAYSTIQLFNNYIYRNQLLRMKDLQIHETIVASVAKVSSISRLMEQNVLDLAIAGEQLYYLKANQIIDQDALDARVKDLLVTNFSGFSEALGGGIWYEPYTISNDLLYYGPYAFRTGEHVEFSWDLNTPEYDYHNQDWYRIAPEKNWGREQNRFRPLFWTKPYFDDAASFALMMTADAIMLDEKRNPIGMSTVDWSLEELTSFLDSVKVTENAVPFFIHKNSGVFLSYPKDKSQVMKSASQFEWGANILQDPTIEKVGILHDIDIAQAPNHIYYYTTHNGFIFGSLIPISDLESQINKITNITLIAGFAIGAAFILLMMLIMRMLFSPFDKVLELIKNSVVRKEQDESQVEIRRIDYKERNEFTPIIATLNEVNKQVKAYMSEIVSSNAELQESKAEIKKLNEALERKVAMRTEQLELKTQEALNSLELLKNTQQQYIENEKHAALGRLVAGIAHEINTPLGIAVTASSTLDTVLHCLQSEMRQGRLKRSEFEQHCERLHECVDMLNTNLQRAADLVLSFKQVAVDQSTDQIRTFRLYDYLQKLGRSMQPKFSEHGHNINVECEDRTLEIRCNPVALTQVLTNILLNAETHGLANLEGGRVMVVAESLDEKVKLTVSDNGNGMAKQILDCIFDPFFTTTRNEGGTGLGLHIVYNLVVQQMGGKIKCESEEGNGTSFTIILPSNGKELALDS